MAVTLIPNAGCPCGAGLGVHNEVMWCLWVDSNNDVQARSWDGTSWSGDVRTGATTGYQPAIADLESTLHLMVVTGSSNTLAHYVLDDGTGEWSRGPDQGGTSGSAPSICAHRGKLYMAWAANNNSRSLLYAVWDPESGWSTNYGTGEATGGTPALVEIDGTLRMVFAEHDADRHIDDLVYDDNATDPNQAWARTARLGDESAGGVAATSFGRYGYLGFQSNDRSQYVMVATYLTQWSGANRLGELAADTPALAVYEDQLQIMFISKDNERSLLWWQGPVADESNATWMEEISGIGDLVLSALSLPGTHDTGSYWLTDELVPANLLYEIPPAIANLYTSAVESVLLSVLSGVDVHAFIAGLVRDMSLAQELSCAEQLVAGARSLDVRAGYMSNGYYTFHGFQGVPISTLLNDIAWFLRSTSNEIVYVWLSPRGMTSDQLTDFRALVTSTLGQYAFPVPEGTGAAEIGAITVSDVLAAGADPNTSRVIVFDDSQTSDAAAGSLIWGNPSAARYADYSNTSTLSTLTSESDPGQGGRYADWLDQAPQAPLFELSFTLTPQTDDIVAEAVNRLLELEVGSEVIASFVQKMGLPGVPPPPAFGTLHELSEVATAYLPTYVTAYEDDVERQFNFISVDFLDDTEVVELAKWLCTTAVTHTRIGVLGTDGTAWVKEGPLNASWVREYDGVAQLALAGNRIGVLDTDGTAWVKEGPLNASWEREYDGVAQLALAGNRIGVLDTDGTAWVKEGPLNASWEREYDGVTQLALAGTVHRVGVLDTDGTAWVKEGPLNASWVSEHDQVAQLVLT